MEILILFNPVSGAGRAAQAATDLADVVRRGGHHPRLAPTRVGPDKSWLDDLMDPVDATIVVGGDGAIRMASGPASRTRTPIVQWPSGTENLFARQFGFNRDADQLIATLNRFDIQSIDLGDVNGRPFVLMVSLGLDANIVQDLDTHRNGSISHLSYAAPILRQTLRWRPPTMQIDVDGKRVAEDVVGQVMVANSRHYAMHLDPAWQAKVDDGLLDLVVMPGRSRAGIVLRSLRYALHRHAGDSSAIYQHGKSIRIACDSPQFFQLDGDPPRGETSDADRRVSELVITIAERALPVLKPPAS